LHLLESFGIGLALGAVVAIAISVLLWHDGRPSVGPALLAMGGGAIVGLTWGAWRRPSSLRSAIRADQQLGTEDLLSTAVALSATDTVDAWANAVLVMAERRTQQLSASSVVLRRLGSRAWGLIGISAAIAVTVAVLAGTAASSATGGKESDDKPAQKQQPSPLSRPLVALIPESPLVPSTADPRRDSAQDAADRTSETPGKTHPASRPAAAGDSDRTTVQNAADGTGPGSSKTAAPQSAAVPNAGNPDQGSGPQTPATAVARSAGGAGAADLDALPVAGKGGATGAESGGQPVPPWQSAGWADDVAEANRRLNTGKVPAAYRDLVRNYFDLK